MSTPTPPKPPPSISDLYRKVEEQAIKRRGRSTDQLDAMERAAKLGQWRQMPLTIGLAIALLAGVWQIWGMRDKLEERIRYEIGVHDRAINAHNERIRGVREGWSACVELQSEVNQLRMRVAELTQQITARRGRRR